MSQCATPRNNEEVARGVFSLRRLTRRLKSAPLLRRRKSNACQVDIRSSALKRHKLRQMACAPSPL